MTKKKLPAGANARKLSAYTIASNCTDKTDCRDGLNEIDDFIRRRKAVGLKVPIFVYGRQYRLSEKLKKVKK